jgi:hypothetical protein
MPDQIISKSRYLSGLQCKLYLWLLFNEPERVPEPDASTQLIFDQGKVVGEISHALFPQGIVIPTNNFTDNIRLTERHLQGRRPIFEAGILAGNLFARADVLNPSGKTAWDIIEVKMSTDKRDVNIQDAAFQKYCYQLAGLDIDRCYLMHINNKYVLQEKIDPVQLFSTVDITDEVIQELIKVPSNVSEMLKIIKQAKCPTLPVGSHCKEPYECPISECWEKLPKNNVFTLYRVGKKAYELYSKGIVKLAEIPDSYKLNEKQSIQLSCIRRGESYINASAIRHFLALLQYPLYFLDFETINPAVPIFKGTRPYQHVPFQFSLLRMDTPSGSIQEEAFLANGTGDPRLELLSHLHEVIGENGSIVVYNQLFEENILRDLGNAFLDYSEWIQTIISRLVDLILPFSNFLFYDPAQNGSISLKQVLPAITGSGYEGLEIDNGIDASLAYLNMIYGNMTKEKKTATRSALLKYCKLDTEALVRIIKRLDELSVKSMKT